MKSGAERCPVPRCGAERKRGHIMCRRHWLRVPREARAEANGAWRQWQAALAKRRAGRDSPGEWDDATARYRAARDVAVAAVAALDD